MPDLPSVCGKQNTLHIKTVQLPWLCLIQTEEDSKSSQNTSLNVICKCLYKACKPKSHQGIALPINTVVISHYLEWAFVYAHAGEGGIKEYGKGWDGERENFTYLFQLQIHFQMTTHMCKDNFSFQAHEYLWTINICLTGSKSRVYTHLDVRVRRARSLVLMWNSSPLTCASTESWDTDSTQDKDGCHDNVGQIKQSNLNPLRKKNGSDPWNYFL